MNGDGNAIDARADGPRAFRVAVVVALAALSFFPIGAWLDTTFQRALSFQAVGWWTGTALVALVAAAFTIVFRDERRAAPLQRTGTALVGAWERNPRTGTAIVACAATLVYGCVAWAVFDARPLLIDEIVQVLQARIYAAGQLWLPVDAHPEFRSVMHMVELDGKWFGQFPPGGPAMLAVGELFRAPWIVNPICGGISVAAFASLLRTIGTRPAVSLGATVIFAFAPFVVFQSASHMNHVPTLMWLLIAAAALARAVQGDRDARLAGFLCGLGLGVAATIRPLDAAAWALPAAAWLGWRAVRHGRWGAFLLSGVGVALPMGAMMWVNAQTTGGALTFGYTVLWGQSHGLGFHESPWGESHTFARGLALTAAYLNRLNEYLFELPIPSLLAPFATLFLARRAAPMERYLYCAAALVVGAYFAYWHDGFYLGPRFMYPVAPVAALLVAQLPALVAARWPQRVVTAGLASVYVASVLVGAVMVLPPRLQSYKNGFASFRWDYDQIASDAGARGATILVRESWGAQVIARMHALGVSRSLTEILYRNVDTCGLDDVATRLEADGTRGAAAEARFRPMLADSARVIESRLSPDATERMLPGSSYPQRCFDRINEDRGGYAHFGPTLLTRDTSTQWLRDLHARDTMVIGLNGRPIWLLRRVPDTTDVIPMLVRVNGDSLRAAWRGTGDPPTTAPRQK